jgi:hypothetical protein
LGSKPTVVCGHLPLKSSTGNSHQAFKATVSYVPTTNKAKLDLAGDLKSGRTYKATVTTGAQDLAGNALDQNPNIAGNQPKSWKFTVQ